IEIKESDIKQITDEIYQRLSALDFSHPTGSPAGMVNPEECSKAYKVWLRKQFDIGLVPRGLVLPSVYAASSNNPLIHQCRPLKFQKEYEEATYERSLEVKQ